MTGGGLTSEPASAGPASSAPVVPPVAQPPGGPLGGLVGSQSGVSGAGRVVVGRRSSVDGLVTGQRLALGGNLVVQGVERLGLGAVKVEPPVADEVVLVEDGAVGTEEAVLGQTALAVSGTDVEHLALGLGVGVVTYKKKNREMYFSKIRDTVIRSILVSHIRKFFKLNKLDTS